MRTEPSAPTEAKMSFPPPASLKAMSYTSLSWAISCVLTWPDRPVRPMTWPVSMPQMVQVVSMLEVPRMFESTSFQSKDVRGAQKSLFLFCLINLELVRVWKTLATITCVI